MPYFIESYKTAKNVSGNQKKYRKQRTELSLQKVRNLQVIGKIANTGVYNCGKANFQKTRNCNLKSISPNSKLC